MNTQRNLPMADHSCPMAFVVVPSFVGALVWLCILLGQVP
jgi:hypothetical protein